MSARAALMKPPPSCGRSARFILRSIADIRVRLGRFRVGRGLANEAVVQERTMERLVTCWVAVAGAVLVAVLAPGYRKSLFSLTPLFLRPFYRRRVPVSVATDIPSLGWSEVYLSLLLLWAWPPGWSEPVIRTAIIFEGCPTLKPASIDY